MSELTSMTLLGQLHASRTDDVWRRFAALYEPLLEGWLRRRGIPQHVAEEVRQEVLAKVYQEIGGFRHNGRTGAFRSWLRSIMTHRLRTIQRRRWRDGEGGRPEWSDVVEQLESDDSMMTQMWNAEHNEYLVRHLLDLVAPEFQEKTLLAFRRVVLENEDAAMVAEELALSVNAVRISQCRVLAAMRRVGDGLLD